jgi:3-oxoadipyl-CoA thiolase
MTLADAFICDAVRTPFGRYAGALSSVRADDLAAIPLKALLVRNPLLEAAAIDDVVLGCANQAGEDNRNVARMALLLAGLPETVPGLTVNRLCGSGLDAIAVGVRMIRTGEADLIMAGGVESMSRAPYVIAKAASPFSRDMRMFDTTMGGRFINPLLEDRYGADSMPETAENVAAQFHISRIDQDRFALLSQERALAAQADGTFACEIVPVHVMVKKGDLRTVEKDEHPRATSLEALSRLATPFRHGGSVTAGNASGINDGAAAVLLASEAAVKHFGLTPRARVLGAAVAGVEPRTMGMGPVPAVHKLLRKLKLNISMFDVIELNEAFAAQALAVLRELGIPDDAAHVNAHGGAIALGHPLGASGARLVTTAFHQLSRAGRGRALCTMCIGVGQGIALALESV